MAVKEADLIYDSPCCGEKFVEIYCNGVDVVIPSDKMYEGLVDCEDWNLV